MATRSNQETVSSTPIEDAARLKVLMENVSASQAEFAAAYGIGSQAQLWQYLNPDKKGGRPLNVIAATGFAKGLGVSVESFSPSLQSCINKLAEFARKTNSDKLAINEKSPTYLVTKPPRDQAIDTLVQIAKQIDSIGIGMLIERARIIAKENPVSKTAQS